MLTHTRENIPLNDLIEPIVVQRILSLLRQHARNQGAKDGEPACQLHLFSWTVKREVPQHVRDLTVLYGASIRSRLRRTRVTLRTVERGCRSLQIPRAWSGRVTAEPEIEADA